MDNGRVSSIGVLGLFVRLIKAPAPTCLSAHSTDHQHPCGYQTYTMQKLDPRRPL